MTPVHAIFWLAPALRFLRNTFQLGSYFLHRLFFPSHYSLSSTLFYFSSILILIISTHHLHIISPHISSTYICIIFIYFTSLYISSIFIHCLHLYQFFLHVISFFTIHFINFLYHTCYQLFISYMLSTFYILSLHISYYVVI
jgi:hypothetical protein